MQTNADITVYNKYRVGHADVYQRVEIKTVHWEARAAHQGVNDRAVNADTSLILIPFMRGADYMPPHLWQALSDKSNNWTLQVGDVIVKGIVSDELEGAFTLSSLKNAYDDVLVISSVDINDYGSFNMQHWEVGAK